MKKSDKYPHFALKGTDAQGDIGMHPWPHAYLAVKLGGLDLVLKLNG